MTVFLWVLFVLGVITAILRAIVVGTGKTTETTPRQHAVSLLSGIGFTIWTGVLLFGGAS